MKDMLLLDFDNFMHLYKLSHIRNVMKKTGVFLLDDRAFFDNSLSEFNAIITDEKVGK